MTLIQIRALGQTVQYDFLDKGMQPHGINIFRRGDDDRFVAAYIYDITGTYLYEWAADGICWVLSWKDVYREGNGAVKV